MPGSIESGTASGIEESGRRRIFVIFLMLMFLPMFLFGTAMLMRGKDMRAYVNYLVCLAFLVLAYFTGRVKSARKLYRLVLMMLILLLGWWINGGAMKGYASIWVLTLPPFAFYLTGKKEGSLWTLVIVAMTAVFFLVPSLSYNGYVYDRVFINRHILSLLLIVFFTYNYESMRERFKLAMGKEQLNLQKEKESLAAANKQVETVNSLLNKEIEIRIRVEDELRRHSVMLEDIVAERTSELRRMNEQLASDEAKYRLMADKITDMIWSTDMDLKYTYISPSVTRIFGYTVEEAMSFTLDRWITPGSLNIMVTEYARQVEIEKSGGDDPDRYVEFEVEQIKKNGDIIPVEVSVSFLRDSDGRATGLIGITRDISERIRAQEENRRMQEQLAQAQKMEAIGTLVGGIAHDFNNILAGIIGSFDLLKRLLGDEDVVKREKINKYLDLGMESSLRSAELVRQLLSLSRKHEVNLVPMDITSSLNHVLDICRNSLPKTVEIDCVIPDRQLVVMGDVVQIDQVLLNLFINASHAMTIMVPDGIRQGGVIKVRAEETVPDTVLKEFYPDAEEREGAWVKIEVSDTGIGMDEETRKRIFEPFFTLKKNEGSGLGLAISYNIIRQHGGMIHVVSEPGFGSCFTVYLPLKHNEEVCNADARGTGEIAKGSGTILVIDDEAVLLNIARGFLEECGYCVITATGGDTGIEIYREMTGEIALVIVDLSMPGKSGIEVYSELKKINSDVTVLLASGMIDPDSIKTAMNLGIKGIVHKPYLADELSVKIKSILQNAAGRNYLT